MAKPSFKEVPPEHAFSGGLFVLDGQITECLGVGMTKNLLTAREAFFPGGRIYEYFLQRLRLVASENARVLQVHEIRDIRDSPGGLPCIEVVLRIPGLKIHNPVTGKPMLSTDWLKRHFEGPVSQQAYLNAFAEYVAESIPTDHPEARLKPKFKHYRDGVPGDLPARADLYVWRDQLVGHLTAAKKWLRGRKRLHQGFGEKDQAAFLKSISHPMFWWAKYVKQGQITLDMIASKSPKHNAKYILALKYDKSYETIRLRLSRKEV